MSVVTISYCMFIHYMSFDMRMKNKVEVKFAWQISYPLLCSQGDNFFLNRTELKSKSALNFFPDKNEIAKIIETIIDDILPKDNSTNPDANDTSSHTDSMLLSSGEKFSTSPIENGPTIWETNCTTNCKIESNEKRDAIGETKSQEDLSRQEYTLHCKMVMGLYIDRKKIDFIVSFFYRVYIFL